MLPPRITIQKSPPNAHFYALGELFLPFYSRLFLVYIFHHVLHAAVQQPAKLIYRVR